MKTTLSTFALAAIFGAAPSFADTAETDRISTPVSQEAPAAWQPEDGDQIVFNVLRKGKEFGTHKVIFDVESNDSFTARSDVQLKAGLGPITVFKYELDATETWKNGTLVALEGRTNDDGDDEFVEAGVDGKNLAIEGSAYSGNAPIGIIPSSHWNIQQAFSRQILSTETGELLDTNVEKIGRDTLTIGGEEVEATHYRLQSDLTVDLWYDDQSRWVKLGFEARGQQIDYVLTQLY